MWAFIKFVFHGLLAYALGAITFYTLEAPNKPFNDVLAPVAGVVVGLIYVAIWLTIISRSYKRQIQYIKTQIVPKDFNPTVEVYGNGGNYYFAFNKPRNELLFYDRKQDIRFVKSGDYLRGYEVESPVTKSGRYYDSVIKLKFDDLDMPFVKFYIDPPELEKKIAQLDLVLNG